MRSMRSATGRDRSFTVALIVAASAAPGRRIRDCVDDPKHFIDCG
jgi:hypothetical protein